MDPVSCLYNFLSIGILCYFVIICFLIKKCCMNCGTNCATDNLCKCFQRIYEGEITPSNHVIVCDGDQRLPISYILNQQDNNEGEYIVGDDGVLYRNEACKECCMRDNVSHSSCNSQEDVFVIKARRGKEICAPCSPSALGLGQGSLRKMPSVRSAPLAPSMAGSGGTKKSGGSLASQESERSCPGSPPGTPCPALSKGSVASKKSEEAVVSTKKSGESVVTAKKSGESVVTAKKSGGSVVSTKKSGGSGGSTKKSGGSGGSTKKSGGSGGSAKKSGGSVKSERSCPGSPPGTPCPASKSSSLKGSPISVASELQSVITPGVEPLLTEPVPQPVPEPARRSPSTKSYPTVDFQTVHAEHVFTVEEGSIDSSLPSREIRGSITSCGSRTSRTSCGSRGSRGSRGSHVSHVSRTSCGSRVSHVSCGSRTSRTSRSPKSGASPKSGTSPKSGASPKSGTSPKSGGSRGPSRTGSYTSVCSKKSCISTASGKFVTGGSKSPSYADKISRTGSSPTKSGGSLRVSPTRQGSSPRGISPTRQGGSPRISPTKSKTGSPRENVSFGPQISKTGSSPGGISPSKSGSSPSRISPSKISDKVSQMSRGPGGVLIAADGSVYSPGGSYISSSLQGAGGSYISGGAKGPGGSYFSGGAPGPGGSPSISAASSHASSKRTGIDNIELSCDGSPTLSEQGVKKTPSVCKPLNEGGSGKRSCGSGSGKSVCSAREERKQSKSGSCISPCKSGGSRSVKQSKSGSGSFKSPCGSVGSPCPFKDSSSRGASPIAGTRRGQPYTPESSYGSRAASPNRNKNVCSGSIGAGSGKNGSPYPYSKSDEASISSTEIITSPEASAFSSPGQKASGKSNCDTCSKASGKTGVEKSPSPILKSPDDSMPAKGVLSPTRVSIKDKYDIITPEGITSAPTFGKDDCDPCPFSPESDSTSGGGENNNTNRRNQILADEYKDKKGLKRKADNISADYKDSTDNSRGSKTARFSNCSYSCSRASSSKGDKSWPSTPSEPSKSEPTSTAATSKVSTSVKCSKCSSKYSSVTEPSSLSSTKTKPSGNSSCAPSCKKSAYSTSTNQNYQTESVTTADIDDYREISPNNSRCENLGAALAKSTCGKIRRALQEVTCEAIRDPSADVVCNDGADDEVCAAIQYLRENPDCPSLLEYMDIVDKMTGNSGGGKAGAKSPCNRPNCASTKKASGTSGGLQQDSDNSENMTGNMTGNMTRNKTGNMTGNMSGNMTENMTGSRPRSAPGTSNTVDAAVIHEISTKVQNCLQHARAIAAKVGGTPGAGGAGGSSCRKTMRVQAKSAGARGQSDCVKVNSKVTLNTKGVKINEYKAVDKKFGVNTGIEVKFVDRQGNVEKFKTPYKDLITADAKGTINIRICSPCKSTPGKLLCVSTDKNPCCTESTTNNTTSTTEPTSSQRKTSPTRVKIQGVESDTSADTTDRNNTGGPSSSQECPNPAECKKKKKNMKDTIVMYERSAAQGQRRTSSSRAECSPGCATCKKKSCPSSKYYKGGSKTKGKLQVYNVTTSHFCQMARGVSRSHFVKGMPIIDAKIYEQYIHPDRYRAGENYLKRRREMIKKIKGKCPWV